MPNNSHKIRDSLLKYIDAANAAGAQTLSGADRQGEPPDMKSYWKKEEGGNELRGFAHEKGRGGFTRIPAHRAVPRTRNLGR